MAKPYWLSQHDGFVFNGNRLHKEEIKTVNAQLIGMDSPPRTKKLSPAYSRRRQTESYRVDNNSTVRERLKGRGDVFQHLAGLAIGGRLPKHWVLSEEGTGQQEQLYDKRVETIQQIGELSVEAAA
jgi:hypothetical protein